PGNFGRTISSPSGSRIGCCQVTAERPVVGHNTEPGGRHRVALPVLPNRPGEGAIRAAGSPQARDRGPGQESVMRLVSLEVENWGPYGGSQTLELDTSASAPVILIEGENERGKTSLFHAIRWALYGRVRDHSGHDLRAEDFANWDARDSGDPFWFGST